MSRRPVIAVVGQGGALDAGVRDQAHALGRGLVSRGFRVATGGLDGVMAAAAQGARDAPEYREGDVVAVLPGYDREAAHVAADLVIPTGLGHARNVVLVAMADVVVAVAGGAGTLSEIAIAWQLGKPVVALTGVGGWSARLGGAAVDERRADRVVAAADADAAVEAVARCLRAGRPASLR